LTSFESFNLTFSISDQLGRKVIIPNYPQRIISLCPSETETLAALVDPSRIVGCTRYCKYPQSLVTDLAKVGGTKKLDFEAIAALKPDLIFAVKEENDRDQIEALMDIYPVIILDPVDHLTTLESIRIIGQAVGTPTKAASLIRDVQSTIEQLPQAHGQRALYLIWRKPYMTVGAGTFIHTMMESMGLENAASDLDGRYPALDATTIAQAAPDIILASSEPFPFEEKHRRELEAQFPNCPIYFVDGEAFGWHGVRSLHVKGTLNKLVQDIHACGKPNDSNTALSRE